MLKKIFAPIALFVFIFLLYALAYLDNGTSIVWTLVIPIVPLFIILVGYNQWRDICPLAFFAKLTQDLHLFKKRKVHPWFEENLYLLQFGVLLSAFSLRLYFLNSSSFLLNVFLISVILLAALSGLVFTGKTWCNFFCPVSLVERVYSSSSSQQSTNNSACSTCTACKTNCPDIDMESSYWKEGTNVKKKIAFYAFPGLVLGFYTYYYLQTGSWDYYFSGDWARTTLSIYAHLTSGGYFFLESLPLFLAVPLTLGLFSILSYLFFSIFEYILRLRSKEQKDTKTIIHIVNVFAAFSAFNIFYLFAGAPTYLQYPIIYTFFHFVIIVVSSTLLYKEIFREEKYYLQEKFARKIVQKWSAIIPPSKNLKEIYYTYVNKEKDHQKHLEIYRETIEDLFFNSILSAENEHIIEKFQKQFNITQDEHEEILSSFKRSCTNISENPLDLSSEKLYQLQHYRSALSKLIIQNPNNLDKRIQSLQVQFNIDDKEHRYIFNKIVNKDALIHDQINLLLNDIITYTRLCKSYSFEKSLWLRYLYFILDENRFTLMQELKAHLNLLFDSEQTKKILQGLHAQDSSNKTYFLETFEKNHTELQERFSQLFDVNLQKDEKFTKSHLENVLKHLLQSTNNKIVACSIYVAIQEYPNALEMFNLAEFTEHPSSIVREIALKLINKTQSLTQIEKEAYLQRVPLFSQIKSNDLSRLASEMSQTFFDKDEILVRENDSGNSLFLITHGQAVVSVHEDQKEKEVAVINEGDYVGEISILSKLPRTATVTAKTSVTTLELSGESFKEFILEYPLVSLKLMQEITQRLIKLKA